MKTYRISVQLFNPKFEPSKIVQGYGLGLLAITPDINARKQPTRCVVITHVPTGQRVSGSFHTKAAALRALPAFVDAADWHFFNPHSAEEPRIGAAHHALKVAGLL
jgi:hypothetical protein